MPYGGVWPIGIGISGAVPFAVEGVRSDPAFSFLRGQGFDLNYTIMDTSCDQGIGIIAFSNLLAAKNNPPIDVYIGKNNLPILSSITL